MAPQEVLTRTLVELADTLIDDFDVVDLLTLLTDRCCEAFDIGDAGLMLAAPMGGDLRVMASSSATMRDLELYELQASEGPCLDCYRTGEPVVNEDLETARGRWPGFAPAALAAGFRSVCVLPMRLRGATIGALNLFRPCRGASPRRDSQRTNLLGAPAEIPSIGGSPIANRCRRAELRQAVGDGASNSSSSRA